MTTRQDVAKEARSWIGSTPYHRRGIIKGVGVDCGSYLGCVLVRCGLIPTTDLEQTMKEIEALSDDWFMHSANEKYVELLSRFCVSMGERITYATPKVASGNIVLMQTSNSNRRNHGAIVTDWPKCCQCSYEGISEIDVSRDPFWAFKNVLVFDPFAKVNS